MIANASNRDQIPQKRNFLKDKKGTNIRFITKVKILMMTTSEKTSYLISIALYKRINK